MSMAAEASNTASGRLPGRRAATRLLSTADALSNERREPSHGETDPIEPQREATCTGARFRG